MSTMFWFDERGRWFFGSDSARRGPFSRYDAALGDWIEAVDGGDAGADDDPSEMADRSPPDDVRPAPRRVLDSLSRMHERERVAETEFERVEAPPAERQARRILSPETEAFLRFRKEAAD